MSLGLAALSADWAVSNRWLCVFSGFADDNAGLT